MKITAGAHPDLPMPFTNGPEPPLPEPVGQLAEPLRLASMRHAEGIRQMSALLGYWFDRNGLSYEQFIAIADWGLNEKGMIERGTLSRLRNGSLTRGASWKMIDALSAANRAIWLWQVKGADKARATLGPHSPWGIKDQWLTNACWLEHPDHPNEPLEFGDLAEVLAGYLDLPYVGPAPLAADDARRASAALPMLLDRLSAERGWGPMAGIRNLMHAYPVNDRGRQQRLRRVLAGEQLLTQDELNSELHALSELIRTVRRLPAGEYGPRELRDELMSGSRPGHG